MVSPNERSGVDVGRASLFAFLRHWPAASERRVRLKYMQYSSDPGDQPAFRARWPRVPAQPIDPSTFRQRYGL